MLTEFSVFDRGPFKERAVVSLRAGASELHPENVLESRMEDSGILGSILVLGPNSAGKSVLLGSLGRLKGLASGEAVPASSEGFAFGGGSGTTEISVSMTSRLIPYTYSISYSSEGIVSESLYQFVTGRRSMVFLRSGGEFRFGKGAVRNRKAIQADARRSFLSVAAESGDEACSDVLRELTGMQTGVPDLEASMLFMAADPELRNVVLRALRLADFRVSDVRPSKEGAIV
ncbi:MAG: ATP-binding protein [Candidatus Methanomethylophilaceae archaeon]|nr:ATP-binding protein [Candidatus Methanomethylophilaceae archaeon]